MVPEKMTKEEILYLAEHTKYYTELLIKQCDSMTTAEEYSRMMVKAARDREKETGILNRITRIFTRRHKSEV